MDTPVLERQQTVRQQIIDLLLVQEATALDISQALGIREKEVAGHLEHIAHSVQAHGRTLAVTPSRCQGCGFVFHDRRRFTRPGRCPRCRGSRLSRPCFRLC
ncbi:MAG: transcriptional regulator [Desulfobacterales bacterium]|nr:transcriptional regulator [Desulfobacterales bacterium]